MSFELTTLGEIALGSNGAVDGPFGSNLKASSYTESGIPVIRGSNLSLGLDEFKSDEFVYVGDDTYSRLARSECLPQDIIFTKKGTLGQTGFVPQEPYPSYLISSNQMRLRVDPAKANPKYVYYWVSSKKAIDKIRGESEHTGVPKINLDYLKKFPISLPSVSYQNSAVEILDNLNDKIALNMQTNQTLEEMAQAIFKSWFVDFDPVKAKMNGEQPEGMDAATAALFPEKLVESELGLIPEGWEAKPLGDYLTIKRGGSPRPIKEFIVPEGYPWTKIADATANDNPYIFKTKEFIKEEGLKKTVYLKKGTLILSNSATPGLPRFLELDACIHDGWLHFPEKKHFTDSYLYQLFLHIRKHLVAQGNGSVFTNLKTDILRNQVVLVPPKQLVDIYEKHASKFLEIVKAKSIESNQLAQLRDTLLPKLLSGEIELGQAQELAEVE